MTGFGCGKFRITNFELRIGIKNRRFGGRCWQEVTGFRVAVVGRENFEFRIKNCELRITNLELRIGGSGADVGKKTRALKISISNSASYRESYTFITASFILRIGSFILRIASFIIHTASSILRIGFILRIASFILRIASFMLFVSRVSPFRIGVSYFASGVSCFVSPVSYFVSPVLFVSRCFIVHEGRKKNGRTLSQAPCPISRWTQIRTSFG